MKLTIDNQLVTLPELRQAWLEPVTVTLGSEAKRRIAESSEFIDEVVAGGETVYGINTGFGMLANVRISDDELGQLQENLVRSHATGVGEDLSDEVVRMLMLMKVIALAEGFSGVRLELVEALCALINNNIYPRIPAKGSVGASGDLAPLAHMAGVLIGVGLFGGALTVPLPLLTLRHITIRGSYLGSLQQMSELMQLVRDGTIKPIPVEARPLAQAQQTLEDLRGGRILGRVVLEP